MAGTTKKGTPQLLELVTDLHKKGLSNRQIASHVDVHWRTIATYLRKLGLTSNIVQKQTQTINIISDTEALCSVCHTPKPITEFQYGRKGQKYEYRFSYCNKCRKAQSYASLSNDITRFLADRQNRVRRRALSGNVPYNLHKGYMYWLYETQKGLCFYTDTPLVCAVGKGLVADNVSIDKVIPERGYVIGNVVLCCNRINTIKSDTTLSELELWMPFFYERVVNSPLITI